MFLREGCELKDTRGGTPRQTRYVGPHLWALPPDDL